MWKRAAFSTHVNVEIETSHILQCILIGIQIHFPQNKLGEMNSSSNVSEDVFSQIMNFPTYRLRSCEMEGDCSLLLLLLSNEEVSSSTPSSFIVERLVSLDFLLYFSSRSWIDDSRSPETPIKSSRKDFL